MYIVGGYLGYQWADFHCGFEMTFLCEYKVNDHEAWRKRRQMKHSTEFDHEKPLEKYQEGHLDNHNSHLDVRLNQRINYTLTNWLKHQKDDPEILQKSNTASREELNSRFKGESFILQNNHNINNFLSHEKNQDKSVILATKRPNKHSVIISTHHQNKHQQSFDRFYQNSLHNALSYNSSSSQNKNDLTNLSNPGSIEREKELNVERTSVSTTTTPMPTTKINTQTYSTTTEPSNITWSIYKFLKNVIKLG